MPCTNILGRNGIYFTLVAASYRGEARGLWINASPRERSLVKFHLSEFRIWKGFSPWGNRGSVACHLLRVKTSATVIMSPFPPKWYGICRVIMSGNVILMSKNKSNEHKINKRAVHTQCKLKHQLDMIYYSLSNHVTGHYSLEWCLSDILPWRTMWHNYVFTQSFSQVTATHLKIRCA